MSLVGNLETNALGGSGFGSGFGGAGFGFGGGGIPPVGLFGVIGNRDGHGHHEHGRKDCEGALFTLNAIGNLKDNIQNAKDSLDERIDSARDNLDGRIDAVVNRVESSKDALVSEARSINDKICEVRSDMKDGFYTTALQNERNTNEIKNQAQLNHLDNDRKFDALSREGERNTALILAKLNQTELDVLRDQLHGERRRGDSREIEINIANTNTNVLTAIQSIRTETDRKFDAIFNQVAKASQDIINVGGILTGVSQTANPVNVK